MSIHICGLTHATTMILNKQAFHYQIKFHLLVTTNPTKPQLSTEKPFSYHDVVRIRKGNFYGYYTIITETGDLSEKDVKDEVETNYLKKSFSKWVVSENDLDSREIDDFNHVEATNDGRSCYIIIQ